MINKEIISTISFPIDLKSPVFKDKFPILQSGALIRNLVFNNTTYVVKITPNFFTENIEISFYNGITNNPICLFTSFRQDEYVNYLLADTSESNYSFTYNFIKKQFELCRINR